MKNKIVLFKDLIGITKINSKTNLEEFVFMQKDDENVSTLGANNKIAVRKTVYEMLVKANKNLQKINKNYKLNIVYGYRSLELQTKMFDEVLEKIKDKFSGCELLEKCHEKIAVPSVAGHPTGGAVDIQIINAKTKKPLDFECVILDYSTNNCVFNSKNKNQVLLRSVLMEVGFSPYEMEWWHFSYGDKEWAFYYNKNEYLYNQISEFKINNENKRKKYNEN